MSTKVHVAGYILEYIPIAQRTQKEPYRLQHLLIAEKALGKPLPPQAQVHHVDGNRANNANTNLVICENATYHMLLHARTRVIALDGDPSKDKICACCGELRSRITDFYKDKSTYDLLSTTCKECVRIVGRPARTAYKKRKALENANARL